MPVFRIEEDISLKAPDDIVNRPRYSSPIEPKESLYIRIAAVYSLVDQSVACGVSDCLQAHTRGFLVTITEERDTNLCEACGKRLFNVTFESQRKALRGESRIREQKLQLNTVLKQSEAIKNRIRELKEAPQGANWLYRALTNFRKAYPAELLTALRELATKKEDSAILSALLENSAEVFHLGQVEQLEGLGIFAVDIREALINGILRPLDQLEEYAENPDSTRSLATHCRWTDSLDEQFALVERLVEEGRAFFKHENLERLKSIPLSEKSTRLTRSSRWDYDNAMAKGK